MPEYILPTRVGPSLADICLGVTETIGLVLTALSAALFASGSFLLLVLGLVIAAEIRLGFPHWLIVGTVTPVVLVGLGIAVWMFQRTFGVERDLTRGTNRLAVLSEGTVVGAIKFSEERPGAPR